MKRFVSVLIVVLSLLTVGLASAAASDWGWAVRGLLPTTVEVVNPIIVTDVTDPSQNPAQIFPGDVYVRNVTVSNISPTTAYAITPRLNAEFTLGNNMAPMYWDPMFPPEGYMFYNWVEVEVEVLDEGISLPSYKAIKLPPNTSKTFAYRIRLMGNVPVGNAEFSVWFHRGTWKE